MRLDALLDGLFAGVCDTGSNSRVEPGLDILDGTVCILGVEVAFAGASFGVLTKEILDVVFLIPNSSHELPKDDCSIFLSKLLVKSLPL